MREYFPERWFMANSINAVVYGMPKIRPGGPQMFIQ